MRTIESGHIASVRGPSLGDIARVLRCSADELVGKPGTRNQQEELNGTTAILHQVGLHSWNTLDSVEVAINLGRQLTQANLFPFVQILLVHEDSREATYAFDGTTADGTPRPPSVGLDLDHPISTVVKSRKMHTVDEEDRVTYYVPVVRNSRVLAVFVTSSDLDGQHKISSRIVITQTLLEEFALVLELASTQKQLDGPAARAAEANTDAVVVCEENVIIDVNEAFEGLSGYRKDELVGSTGIIERILRPVSQGETNQFFLSSDNVQEEALVVKNDGTVTPVCVVGMNTQWHGATVRTMVIRDNLDNGHDRVVSRVQDSFLGMTSPGDMSPILRAAFSEMTRLGVTLEAFWINTVDEANEVFSRALVNPFTMAEFQLDSQDTHALLQHWQRQDVLIRSASSGYVDKVKAESGVGSFAPVEVVDVPFRLGTVGVAIRDRHIVFPNLVLLLQRIAETVDSSLGRIREMADQHNSLINRSWKALREAVAVIDSNGVVCQANNSWEMIAESIGFDVDLPVVGQDIRNVSPSGESAKGDSFLSSIRGVMSGRRVESDVDITLRDNGDSRSCNLRAIRLDGTGAGKDWYVMLTVSDN